MTGAQPSSAASLVPIVRWENGVVTETTDELSPEEPLEIRVNGRAVSVTMRTPGHDAELAAGFLLTEGVITSAGQLESVEHCRHSEEGNVLNVQLRPGAAVDFERLSRHVFASSSCGICGKATIDALMSKSAPIESTVIVAADAITKMPESMRAEQATFSRTGGLHAAALFDPTGQLLVLREDVGRHNAVDKVIGLALRQGQTPLSQAVLMVSGRSSFEIVQKAAAARIPIVAAVSAPSSLAANFATEAGQTLIGFLRGRRMNIYSHPHRIRF